MGQANHIPHGGHRLREPARPLVCSLGSPCANRRMRLDTEPAAISATSSQTKCARARAASGPGRPRKLDTVTDSSPAPRGQSRLRWRNSSSVSTLLSETSTIWSNGSLPAAKASARVAPPRTSAWSASERAFSHSG